MPNFRVFFWLGLAIVLMVLDQKVSFFQKVRADLTLVVFPVQYLVNAPFKIINSLTSHIVGQQQLVADNARLRAHELLLESKLQKLLALELENAQLRDLLKAAPRIGNARVIVADLLAVDLNPALHQVVVNKGADDHIYVGQPVLDANGVMGQVVQLGLLTSRVMLISSPKSGVPVQDYRSEVPAIAVGVGNVGRLELINVPVTSDVQKGDLFVSSGLGSRYPAGYPVGVVSEINRNPSQQFVTISLTPSAHLHQSQPVLMVWPK